MPHMRHLSHSHTIFRGCVERPGHVWQGRGTSKPQQPALESGIIIMRTTKRSMDENCCTRACMSQYQKGMFEEFFSERPSPDNDLSHPVLTSLPYPKILSRLSTLLMRENSVPRHIGASRLLPCLRNLVLSPHYCSMTFLSTRPHLTLCGEWTCVPSDPGAIRHFSNALM